MAMTNQPSLEILLREPDGFVIWNGYLFGNSLPPAKLDKVTCFSAKFSEDGLKLMFMKSESEVGIYDCRSWREKRSFQVPNVLAAIISLCGSHLQTFQKSASPQDRNVVLWKTQTGDSVYHLSQRNMTKATWDFSKDIVHRLRVTGVDAVELSKTPGAYVADLLQNQRECKLVLKYLLLEMIYKANLLLGGVSSAVQLCTLSWNSGSTGLLVLVQSDVNKTNRSYHGESKLNYLTTDGTYGGLVPLRILELCG